MKIIRRFVSALLALALLGACASAQGIIDATAAENAALADAGVSREQALLRLTETETEHGIAVFDVEFSSEGLRYEYWIGAQDGAIVKRSWELTSEEVLRRAAGQDAAADVLGEARAQAIALACADLTEEDATVAEVSLDREDGLRLYEVTFYTTTAEYEYDIDAVSGEPVAERIEYFAAGESLRPGQQSASPGADSALTRQEARACALADAGLSENEVTFTKSRLDREDGVLVYEIEFVTSSTEYEYEIDASTGSVRARSMESRASGTADGAASSSASSGSAGYIGVDRAKEIAVEHAGLSAGAVVFTKAKLEKDGSARTYEVEFTRDGVEYEYEIDALIGSILEYEIDRDD